ncbi:MAG TPA: hypothetical protein DDW76_10400 [Cyanobacteria bacterium UBA11369]|nr:hypothetical protein [Cyanobacteria bacterium UBA11371]HBE49182.1 hypothetical protein [Cyanobacteria bacterium UBA11369]
MSLSAENSIELLHAFMKLKPFNQKPPTQIYLDMYAELEGVPDWIERWVPTCTHGVTAFWGNFFEGGYVEGSLCFDRYYRDNTQVVKVIIDDYPCSVEAVLEMLSPLPWRLATFSNNINTDWLAPEINYRPPNFRDRHYAHGWGCAFKGAGHNHLVSRRWLEYGPWRLIRDEANDISLVQFHDLFVDAVTALEQAQPGHERMGVSDTGGFINSKFEYSTDIRGLYNSDNHQLTIVNTDRPVTQREMLDLCAARYQQILGPEQPIDSVSYVFLLGEQGYDYLHELWLREIECWAILKGVEVRLDTDYHPTPEIPDWVRRLQATEEART